MKLKDKLRLIQRAAPKRSKYGQLHSKPAETKGRWKKVVLITLFVAEDRRFLLRNHHFVKAEPKTAAGWHDWFSRNLKIIQGTILEGLEKRTSKQWSVKQIIGWIAHVKYESLRPAVVEGRNKTNKQRRTNG